MEARSRPQFTGPLLTSLDTFTYKRSPGMEYIKVILSKKGALWVPALLYVQLNDR